MKYITVISARTLFEESHPDNVEKWKELTFLSLKQKEELDSVPLTNLIVIGDAEFEMAAGEELARTIGQCVFKQIKLQEGPSPEDLVKEIKVINEQFERIVGS